MSVPVQAGPAWAAGVSRTVCYGQVECGDLGQGVVLSGEAVELVDSIGEVVVQILQLRLTVRAQGVVLLTQGQATVQI